MVKAQTFLSKQKRKDDQKKRQRILKEKSGLLEKLKERIKKGRIGCRDSVVMKLGEITRGVRKYFKIKHKKSELNFSYSLSESAIAKEKKLDGKYVICCTDTEMSSEQVLLAYKDKDKAEKAFRCIKSFIKVRPIRHWKSNRVKAHIFLCILSYLLEKVLEYKLLTANTKMTAQEALNELSSVKMITYKVGSKVFDKVSRISEKQKLILKKLSYWPI